RALVALEVVRAEPPLALPALDQGIGEVGDVARGHPDLRVRNDRGFDAHDVVTLLDHGAPPQIADVAPHLGAQGTVVVGGGEAAVDLSGGENEPSTFRERN